MDETMRDTPEQVAERMLRQGESRATTTRVLIARGLDPDVALSAVQWAWQLVTQEAEVRAKRWTNELLRRTYALVQEQYDDDEIIELLDESVELTDEEKDVVLAHIPEMRAQLEKEREDHNQWMNHIYEYAADLARRRITPIRMKELLINEQGLDDDEATAVITNLPSYREQRKRQKEKQQEYIASIYQRVVEQFARGDTPSHIKHGLIDEEGLDDTTSEMVIRRVHMHRVSDAHQAAGNDIGRGAGVLIVGLLITGATFALASGGGIYIVAWGAVLFGGLRLLVGCARWLKAEADSRQQLFTESPSLVSERKRRTIVYVTLLLLLVLVGGTLGRRIMDQPNNQLPSGFISEALSSTEPSMIPSRQPLITATPDTSFQPTAVVVAQTLNLRDGPGTIYALLGQIQAGDKVQIIGQASLFDWFKVRLSDRTEGWVPIDTTRLTFDASARNVPEASFRMRTGSIQKGYGGGGKARGVTGELTLYNDNTIDMLVVLLRGQDTYTAAFIRSNDDFKFAGIMDGAYSLFFTPGANWNGATFTNTATGWRFAELLSFKEIQGETSGYLQYYTPSRHVMHIPSNLENNSLVIAVPYNNLPMVTADLSKKD